MAGIENIVVHSKSYIVRWIQVPEHHSISWSVQPQRKSVNFGIFKHPGNKNGLAPSIPTFDTLEPTTSNPSTPGVDGATEESKKSRRNSASAHNVVDKLQGIGLRSVAWTGKCHADKVSVGRYDVAEGEGGMYGLVFDNTFSKQTSKTVMFVLMTHPTNAPPKSGHHLHYSQAFSQTPGSSNVRKSYSPSLKPVTDSNESLPNTRALHASVLEDPRPKSKGKGGQTTGEEGSSFYTGVMHKKRRKKGQGYARRFFSLDFTSCTLSYYHDRHSSALRGAVPLSLAAVGVNEKTREFSVDSGAEVWHLKALNKKDFEGWRHALDRASEGVSIAPQSETQTSGPQSTPRPRPRLQDPAEASEWARVEQLVSQVAGTRDALRGFAKDTDPKYMSGVNGVGLGLTRSRESSLIPSPASQDSATQYFPDMVEPRKERKSMWNRKSSTQNLKREKSPMALFKRSASTQLAVPAPSNSSADALNMPKRSSVAPQAAVPEDVHNRCMALLNNLDSVVSDFSSLLAESRARRLPPTLAHTNSRMSLDSIDQEFFDAEDGPKSPSQLLSIRRSSEFEDRKVDTVLEQESDGESDEDSEAGDAGEDSMAEKTPTTTQKALFPSPPKSLPPLPLPEAKRRSTIAGPKQAPPSIMGFLRKNAGKDLSTASMPVTANEPTSLLQRLAESVEYPQLLDKAAASPSPEERLMYVTAFAISYYSNSRVKERALRKPFNPMLGETYELVREDLGFRFVSEKVSHHPVRLACQAESLTNGGWSFAQSPQPIQKFWGKSMEVNNEGRARVVLHGPRERYSWNQATCFLRNVMAGEKYVEPVQSMTVHGESSSMRAVATFKAGGMFSGRSEDVSVQFFGADQGDAPLSLGLQGKWTDALKRTDTGATVWSVGALAPDAPKVFGFTAFAAALNQTTAIEEGHLPPTDTRLRPDQQALEHSDADRAEGLKARLEERQRGRRKTLEAHGQKWRPQFFERVGGKEGEEEEAWLLRDGGDGYWERRERGDWKGIEEVFET